MQISHATQASPGRANEDYAAAGPDWAIVLDGATPAPGAPTGCRHDVRWLVGRLAAGLAARLARRDPDPLAGLLAAAIAEASDAHARTCDLDNPATPSSTVSAVRIRDRALDYLVLCDSPLLLRHRDGTVRLVADERLAGLPRGVRHRELRNKPGGFWVASSDPAAAHQAVTGSVAVASLTDAALLTDGVTRLAEWYGHPWAAILDRLAEAGPAALIDLVRAEERADPRPRVKTHDDATAVHIRF